MSQGHFSASNVLLERSQQILVWPLLPCFDCGDTLLVEISVFHCGGTVVIFISVFYCGVTHKVAVALMLENLCVDA